MKGCKQLHGAREHIAEHPLGPLPGGLVLFVLQTGLGQFDVPVAVGIPNEGIELFCRNAQLVAVHVLGDFFDQVVVAGEDPFVVYGQMLGQAALLRCRRFIST